MERIFGNSSTPNAASWRPEPRERGTYSILSTCIITLGLCVWTAIHLNVPAHRGYWQQVGRKFGWMVLGFLAPELVTFAAFQQYTVARNITKNMQEGKVKESKVDEEAGKASAANNGRRWSFVHSYFAAMGGFAFEIEDGKRNFFPLQGSSKERPTRLTITDKGLLFLEKRRPELIPNLPRARIEDKSKGSMLAKLLVCFQATWFCVQCISRLAQRLPISLLELNTFGHAVCTLLIYCMWWKKPLDIEEPELIPVRGEDTEMLVAAMCVTSKLEVDPQDPDDDKLKFAVEWDTVKKKGRIRKGYFLKRRRKDPLIPISQLFGKMFSKNNIRLILTVNTNLDPADVALTADDPADAAHRINGGRFGPGLRLTYEDTYSVEVVEGNTSSDEEDTPVPEAHFDIPRLDLWRWALAVRVVQLTPPNSLAERTRNFPRFDQPLKQWPLYLAFAVIGLAYGGLHCLAWDAPFATDLERTLWRVSSVAVTSTGAVIALGFTWAVYPPFWIDWSKSFDRIEHLADKAGFDEAFEAIDQGSVYNSGALGSLVGIFLMLLLIMPLIIAFAVKILFDLIVTAVVLFYTLARVYLVVECFINLAHLPDGAYQVPQWAQYVPHIA